nr:hypothetical protein [Lentzea californiensis]
MLRSLAAPSTSAAAAIGSIMMNSQRQLSPDSTTPDRAGPTAGAMAGTAVAIAISRPRRAAGARRMVVVISRGRRRRCRRPG